MAAAQAGSQRLAPEAGVKLCRAADFVRGVLCTIGLLAACADTDPDGEDARTESDSGEAGQEDTGAHTPVSTEPPLLVCDAISAGFADCGGTPAGFWRIRQWCPDGAAYDPLSGTCPDVRSLASGGATGVIQFGSDNEFVVRLESAETDIEFNFDLGCYGGSTAPCDGANFGAVCELVDNGDRCECVRQQSIRDELRSGTWRRNGSFIEMRLEGEPLAYARFCIGEDGRTAELALPELVGVLPASVQLTRIE